jgi:DnaJ-class molecular chaperone
MTKKKRILDGYKTYDTSEGFGDPRQWRDAFYQRMTMDQAIAIIKGQPETPYEILKVPKNASKSEIKTAFKKLLWEWHPDRNPHRQQEANDMMAKIIAAYEVLS